MNVEVGSFSHSLIILVSLYEILQPTSQNSEHAKRIRWISSQIESIYLSSELIVCFIF